MYINEENLQILNNDPAAENYVQGSLVFEGKTIKNVGIRYKGSVGAWVGCLSGINWTNPSGYKTCPKLSMKIKINWKDDKKFYGMKKLQFHSQNLDPSKMHERLGYYMYRNFGVIAPRSNHALVYINGVFNGVFANTENIDGPFTNKHFENPDGNLYKEVWPVDIFGESQEINYFIDGLKTNEEISDVSKIKKLPGSTIEDLSDWQTISELLLTKSTGNWRKKIDADSCIFIMKEEKIMKIIIIIGMKNRQPSNSISFHGILTMHLKIFFPMPNPVTPIKDEWYEN